MRRRDYLAAAGAVAGAGVVGAAMVRDDRRPDRRLRGGGDDTPEPTESPSSSPTRKPVRFADRYETVVDAVEAGADPTGADPVNDVFDEHAADDTLLSFPPGTYRLAPLELEGFSGFGVAAATDEPPTFVPVDDTCHPGGRPYLHVDDVADFQLAAVDFDFRLPGSGGELRFTCRGDATISDVSAVGNCEAQVAMARVDVVEPDATAVVENFRLRNDPEDPSLTGIYVGEQHAGELRFRDCSVNGFSGNGLYASAPGRGRDGGVHVDGGTYANNNIANVRIGSTGSTVRGATVYVDRVPPEHVGVNARGIRLREKSGQVIENCTVRFASTAGFSFGGIVFHPDNRGAFVRNTTVEINRDGVRAITALPRRESSPEALVFENVEMTGTAANDYAALVDGRDETVFRNCTITQSGDARSGIYFRDSADCLIENCRIDVTEHLLTIRGSNVAIRDTTLVTPDGERTIDEMEATDEDFTPRGSK